MIESHIHILPGIDDGSDSMETSESMLAVLQKQGIDRIIATPHFYAHREKSLQDYLAKRQKAFDKLRCPDNFLLGAEIAVERGISEIKGIDQLAFTDSDLILLEFPYDRYHSWLKEEIYNISVEYKLTPVIAHIHRYLNLFTKTEMENILEMNVIFQVNNEAFGNFRERCFVNRLLKDGYPIVFGSDSHNLGDRKPNWDFLKRRVKAEKIDESMKLLASHLDICPNRFVRQEK